ncbi:MAG: DNA gyrase subunit A, partial [Rhodopirellula bahusiensis]
MAEDGENQEPGDENAGEVNGSSDNGGQENGAGNTDAAAGGGTQNPPGSGNPPGGAEPPPGNGSEGNPDPHGGHGALRMVDLPIEDELRESYLTYAMSVI